MITASKEFKEKLKRNRAPLANYADVTLSDGTVLHLEPKDFRIGGCTIEDKTTDGGKFGVGFVIGKTLSIRLENGDERFSQYDFYNSIIRLYVGTLLDDGTVERIRKGVYYTLVPETPGDVIEISAVDGMYRLDKDYSASTTTYPATLQAIITGACLDCGIPIGFQQFDNMNYAVKEKPENATYRQVVSWAAQIAGYNARIDNDGYMHLVWYDTSLLSQYTYDGGGFKNYSEDVVVDGGNFTDYSADVVIDGGSFTDANPEHIFRIKPPVVSTDDVVITGVRVANGEEKDVLFGEKGYLIEVVENPFVSGKEEQVADYLGGRMVGMAFRPFSAETLQNPLYEPFDVVKVSDQKGNSYLSILNSVSFTIGSRTQVACEAEDPVRNGSTYVSVAAQAVVNSRRNTKNQLTAYDKAVQDMTQIAMNAMGYHVTFDIQPDGSRITYLHDRPALEDSQTIYKRSIDGFFVSTDGGKSYTAGFDKNGNAVVNILYAIGIVADWIRTGTFSVQDSLGNETFYADKDTGDVRINAKQLSIAGTEVADINYVNSALQRLGENMLKGAETLEEAFWEIGIADEITRGLPDPEGGESAVEAYYVSDVAITSTVANMPEIKKDVSYEFSVWVKVSDTDTGIFLSCVSSYLIVEDTSTEWKKYTFLVRPGEDTNADVLISFYSQSGLKPVRATVYNPCLKTSLSPEQVFESLTDGGRIQGMYMLDGQLYINASYIQSGVFKVAKNGKNTFFADADTGEVHIIADSFELSSGDTIESIAGSVANSSLKVVNDSISAEVTRATGAEGVLSSRITTAADNIALEVNRAKGAEEDLESKITLNANQIALKVTAGEVSSLIEQKADSIRLKADKIAWSSTYSSLTEGGILTCTSGTIGGFTIGNTKIFGTSQSGKVVVMQKGNTDNMYAFAAGGSSHEFYSDCPFRVRMNGEIIAQNASIKGKIIADDVILKSVSVKYLNVDRYAPGATGSITVNGVSHQFIHGIYVGTNPAGNPNAPFEI